MKSNNPSSPQESFQSTNKNNRHPSALHPKPSRLLVTALLLSLVTFSNTFPDQSSFSGHLFANALESKATGIFDRLEKKMGEKERMLQEL